MYRKLHNLHVEVTNETIIDGTEVYFMDNKIQ